MAHPGQQWALEADYMLGGVSGRCYPLLAFLLPSRIGENSRDHVTSKNAVSFLIPNYYNSLLVKFLIVMINGTDPSND